MEELSVTMTHMRKRKLGNAKFVGELFKLKMLSETIMHECITKLLKSSSDEEALECFAKLMTTTGKDLDHPEAKVGCHVSDAAVIHFGIVAKDGYVLQTHCRDKEEREDIFTS